MTKLAFTKTYVDGSTRKSTTKLAFMKTYAERSAWKNTIKLRRLGRVLYRI